MPKSGYRCRGRPRLGALGSGNDNHEDRSAFISQLLVGIGVVTAGQKTQRTPELRGYQPPCTLYNGSELSLTVFADNGVGGTANDGAQNGSEAGLNNVTVSASIGGTSVTSATTGSAGTAALWLPATSSGTVLLTPVASGGDLATGGSAGTTGGAYARPSVTFSFAAGNTYMGVTFGLVPPNSLAPNGAQTAQAGTTVFYPHSFVAGSAGQVTFSTSAVASPMVSGWTQAVPR